MIEDMCKFFQKLEEDPATIVKFTVRDYLLLRAHLDGCDVCFNRQ